jgi:hypothetical protein
MNKMMTTRKLIGFAALLAGAALVGCSNIHGENFDPDGAPRRIGAINESQTAAGAKEDAILYDAHFHGSELTSLGEGKLDLIVKGTPEGDPITVYLSVPHASFADRQAAVKAYLTKAGIQDDKMLLAEGGNPNLTTPAAYNLGNLYKADGASFNGQAAPEASTGGGGGGGPASGK